MYFRQLLPDGIERFGFIAADGQMGQIMKVYMDWQLSGYRKLLEEFWPKRSALSRSPGFLAAGTRIATASWRESSTTPTMWSFMGPIRYVESIILAPCGRVRKWRGRWPKNRWRRNTGGCSIVARHGSIRIFSTDRSTFRRSKDTRRVRLPWACAVVWERTIQKSRNIKWAPAVCIDQLLGQYLADVAGLGTLLDPKHVHDTLDSIYRYNHKANLLDHDCVQRTYALNDEAATLVCEYAGSVERPKIPFPYYAEVWTGLEYSTAALMLFREWPQRGLECFSDVRRRYDGERRNPWDEPECGHHYARAMASWSGFLAASGFRYRGQERRVEALPRLKVEGFRSFWAAGTGWGTFELSRFQIFHYSSRGIFIHSRTGIAGACTRTAICCRMDGKASRSHLQKRKRTTHHLLRERIEAGGQREVSRYM